MTLGQKVLLAVAQDNVQAFQALNISNERLIKMTFEEGMNILNLALDQF